MASYQRLNQSRHPSVSLSTTSRTYYNKTFEDTTDLFFFACAHGDYMLVHRLLQEGEVQADVSNKMGKSALQIAIENEHFEVVKVLLDKIPYENFRDALLLAIYLGHTNIAEFIMNHPIYLTFYGGFRDPIDPQAYDESQFSADITPLILAAQYNRLQIVHRLLSRGEVIKIPHPTMCSCIDCDEISALDSFRQAQVRLSAYKGLSSEVYIALAYPDPILQAFRLSHQLRTLTKTEHYFREDYQKLANQLSIFVTRLLDNVRGHEELEIVLNKTGEPDEEQYENLARFDLAIQYQEKAFVAHSNCQQKLMEKWYENLSAIKNAHTTKRALFYLAFIACLPILSIIYVFLPKSKIGSLCSQPNLKFKAYIVSYLTFVGLIVASSYFSASQLQYTQILSQYNTKLYEKYIQYIYKNNNLKIALSNLAQDDKHSLINCDISLRFMEPNPFQIAIFIWVLGFIWQEFKQIFSSGRQIYFNSISNYVDCSMNFLYMIYFGCLYASMILTRTSMKRFESEDYWRAAANYGTMPVHEKVHFASETNHILYWLNADRYYWTSSDLLNIAEAFFAMGNVMSICRICFLLPIIGFVGPLQIMLERMIIDILKWLVIMMIFFSGFACSLYLIFSHYSVSLQQRDLMTDTSSSFQSGQNRWRLSNDTWISNSRCPLNFIEFLNRTDLYVIHPEQNNNFSSSAGSTYDEFFCGDPSDYEKLKQIGSSPAIHYFGERIGSTVLTTFFTLFGVIADDDLPDRGYELISLSCNKPKPGTYQPGFDQFVSNLGFILYGLFSFVCVTVLINTLIAMMEETIDAIDDRADVEWKYARSKLYMEYIREGNTLAVPLNICPTPKSIIYIIQRTRQFIRAWRNTNDNSRSGNSNDPPTAASLERSRFSLHHGQRDRFNNEGIFNRKRSSASNETLTYKVVMKRIVKRFLIYYKHKSSGSTEKNDGLEIREFKNDVSSLKFELLNEIEMLDRMRNTMFDNMTKLNENLRLNYDFERIQQYLDCLEKEQLSS